jgi:hypothetical protein
MSILIVLCDAKNSLIPIPKEPRSELLPKTHERIIVPVDGYDDYDKLKPSEVKPVHEETNETNYHGNLIDKHHIKQKQKEKNETEKVSPRVSRRVANYVIHHHPHPPHPLIHHNQQQHNSNLDNTNIQPLHTDTSSFKTSRPNSIPIDHPSINGKYRSKIRNHESLKSSRHPQDSRKKLRVANLPPNPEEVPKTDWFDNTGKFHYGVRHGDVVLEPAEYAIPKKHEKATTHAPENAYKSSYRGPLAQVTVREGDGLGNFLYKSEVFFPNNGNNYVQHPPIIHASPTPIVHHFTPVTTPAAVELKTTHAQPIFVKKPTLNSKLNSKSELKNSKGPYEAVKMKEEQRAEEEDDDYDEEDDDDDDNDDNDNYHGPSPDDNDDEDSSRSNDDEDSSRSNDDEDYENDDDDDSESSNERSRNNDSGGGSFEYDRAWDKYGYGNHDDESESGSYESSETRNVPKRIKFYHEKREETKTPSNKVDPTKNFEIKTKVIETSTASPVKVKQRVKNVSISTKLNNNNNQPKAKPKSVTTTPRTQAPKPEVRRSDGEIKPKQQKSDAADDLKYFQ